MIQIIGPPLSQWDNGRSIEASGSTATHAHFANRGDSYAVIMELVDGKTKIPDYLLQTNKDLFIYLVLDGVTQESKTFSVRKREKPENYVYEDDQRNYIKELIEDAKAATNAANQVAQDLLKAKENGEFNGKDAEGVDLSDYYTKAEADQKLQQYMSPVLPTLQSHDERITALNDEVGDISAALDGIIAIQNELLGIITFTVEDDDHVYTANKNMSWYGWVESEYNTTDFYIDGHVVRHESEDALGLNGETIEPRDCVIADAVYERL